MAGQPHKQWIRINHRQRMVLQYFGRRGEQWTTVAEIAADLELRNYSVRRTIEILQANLPLTRRKERIEQSDGYPTKYRLRPNPML